MDRESSLDGEEGRGKDCRLRPLRNDEQESCAEVISDTVLQILPPECSLAFKSGHRNAVSFFH